MVGGFIHLRILQESQFGRLKVSSTLRVLPLVSLAACPPETPRWEPGPRARLDGGRGAERGVCVLGPFKTHRSTASGGQVDTC